MSIQSLIGEYGSPLYCFDEKGFRDNYSSLCNAFRSIYPNYILGYSYKTNYTPYICKLVKDLGGYAEVVSDMEYEVARRIGYDDSRIIYNGPVKGPMMESHILNEGISNIDNESEAERVVCLAKAHPNRLIKIGIRINSDIGAGFVSRFGIEIDSPSFDRVVSLLKSQSNIRIVGLHTHVSRARYLSAWRRRIENLLYVADKYIDGVPEYIDVGSGMFAEMEDFLKSQFKIDIPTYREYAQVVAGTMAEHYKDADIKPWLISEPGTTVVSRYLSILTTVTSVKEICGNRYAIVDCDYHNTGETSRMMKCPFTVFHVGSSEKKIEPPLHVVGYTCLEQDCIFKDFQEQLNVGDVLEFRNIGGYSIVYKPPFIQPNCSMVAKKEGGSIELIKRKETFEDIFRTFVF